MRWRPLFFALACLALRAAPAQALICVACRLPVTHTWPTDPSPCGGGSTLQACIDSASPGDTVQIATNAPIDEAVSIQQGLTLEAASGFHPLFSAGQSITAVASASSSTAITIAGLTITSGSIRAFQSGTGPLTIQIMNNTVTTPSADLESAIEVDGGSSGTGGVTFEISANSLSTPAPSDLDNFAYGVQVSCFSTSATGRVAHNSISMGSTLEGSAISLTGSSLNVDVIANHISGTDYDAGILVSALGGGGQARVLDNLVAGQSGNVGLSAAIGVSSGDGSFDVSIVNNTIADDQWGVATRVDGTGTLSGIVANNIIADSGEVGIEIDSGATATLENSNNLLFSDPQNALTAGPGTVEADPLFIDPPFGDYHVKPGSPAIDAGDDSAVPATDLDGNPITDLDDNPRIQGAHVDIGAYETAPEPDAQTLAVTALAALLGVAASEAARASRRRAG